METQDKYPDMETWLSAQYFIENPFEHFTADLEKDRKIDISEYFYQFPYFEGTVKPKCSFLFLKRGTGKSANRVMLERLCEESVSSETKLAVPYTDFSRLISKQQVALEDHIGEILREAVPRLFVEAIKQKKTNHLQQEYAKDFAWFISRYSKRLNPQSIKDQLKELKRFSEEQKKEFLLKLLELGKKSLEKLIGEWTVLIDLLSMLVKFTEDGKDSLPDIQHSPMELMTRFAEISQQLKINHIYILIDRVDEYAQKNDFLKSANMLKSLIETIPLLEMRPYSFKFFLPSEMKSDISSSLREDRFDIYEYTWKAEELAEMFKNRLSAYCDKKILSEEERESFSRLFAPEMRLKYPHSDKIEPIVAEMIEIINKEHPDNPNSPRYLLKLANIIFDEHCRRSGFFEIEHYISEKTYKDAVEKI